MRRRFGEIDTDPDPKNAKPAGEAGKNISWGGSEI
jgi:hypothetical protein